MMRCCHNAYGGGVAVAVGWGVDGDIGDVDGIDGVVVAVGGGGVDGGAGGGGCVVDGVVGVGVVGVGIVCIIWIYSFYHPVHFRMSTPSDVYQTHLSYSCLFYFTMKPQGRIHGWIAFTQYNLYDSD